MSNQAQEIASAQPTAFQFTQEVQGFLYRNPFPIPARKTADGTADDADEMLGGSFKPFWGLVQMSCGNIGLREDDHSLCIVAPEHGITPAYH